MVVALRSGAAPVPPSPSGRPAPRSGSSVACEVRDEVADDLSGVVRLSGPGLSEDVLAHVRVAVTGLVVDADAPLEPDGVELGVELAGVRRSWPTRSIWTGQSGELASRVACAGTSPTPS